MINNNNKKKFKNKKLTLWTYKPGKRKMGLAIIKKYL